MRKNKQIHIYNETIIEEMVRSRFWGCQNREKADHPIGWSAFGGSYEGGSEDAKKEQQNIELSLGERIAHLGLTICVGCLALWFKRMSL